MSIVCAGTRPRAMRITVSVRRKGYRTERRLRRVTVPAGRVVSFVAKGRLRPGDRLVLRRAKTATVPRLSAALLATRRLGAR